MNEKSGVKGTVPSGDRRGSPLDSRLYSPLHNAKKFLELLCPWDKDAVLVAETGLWTSEMTQKYTYSYGDNCTPDDLEAIAATRGLGYMIANNQSDAIKHARRLGYMMTSNHSSAVKQAFMESVRTRGFNVWNQLMLFGINTPYFGRSGANPDEPYPEWVNQMQFNRHVNRPAASGPQTNDAYFDTIKDGFVPLLHALLTDEQTRGKMYRATNRGWLSLLPGKLQELEEATTDKPALQAMHNQIATCGAILRCYPPPSTDAEGDKVQRVCRYCWEYKKPMFRCSGACGGSAMYCCSEHQKADWQWGHKKECKECASEPKGRDPITMNEDGSADVNLTLSDMRKLFPGMSKP